MGRHDGATLFAQIILKYFNNDSLTKYYLRNVAFFCTRQFQPGHFSVIFFFSGLPKIVEVHTTTGRRGKLWPADAGPEGGDYWSSCELEQFLESQRKKPSPESDSNNGFKG